MKQIVTGELPVAAGKFLRLRIVEFRDDRGRERKWESADRVNCPGAAMMIAHIIPDDEWILIRQFRPPTGRLMLEFPAGLIDPGEDAAATAVRELHEETGYTGTVKRIFSPGWSSPGLTGEAITIVTMEVDGNKYRDRTPVSAQEDSECIECFRVKTTDLSRFVAEQEKQGVGVDTKIYTFLLGMEK